MLLKNSHIPLWMEFNWELQKKTQTLRCTVEFSGSSEQRDSLHYKNDKWLPKQFQGARVSNFFALQYALVICKFVGATLVAVLGYMWPASHSLGMPDVESCPNLSCENSKYQF